MSKKIKTPIVVIIDIRCTVDDCDCERSVPGRLLNSGGYAAPEEEPLCTQCGHPNNKHNVIGETKSKLENKHSRG